MAAALWTAANGCPQALEASSGAADGAGQAVGMPTLLPDLARIAQTQADVVSRQQALDDEMSPDAIGRRVRSGYWRQLGRGVYLVSAATPSRTAQPWAAVHQAGPEAALSHHTAAELHKITDQPSALIHVTVPESRRVRPVPGIVVHHLPARASGRLPGNPYADSAVLLTGITRRPKITETRVRRGLVSRVARRSWRPRRWRWRRGRRARPWCGRPWDRQGRS